MPVELWRCLAPAQCLERGSRLCAAGAFDPPLAWERCFLEHDCLEFASQLVQLWRAGGLAAAAVGMVSHLALGGLPAGVLRALGGGKSVRSSGPALPAAGLRTS